MIKSYALDNGIPYGLADWLLPLLNLTSVLGRTIPNWLADRYGLFEVNRIQSLNSTHLMDLTLTELCPQKLYIPCALLSGVMQFAIGGATSSGGLVVVSVL